MSKQIAIEKIVLRIGKRRHKLTVEEAKELQRELDTLLNTPRHWWGWGYQIPVWGTITTTTPTEPYYVISGSIVSVPSVFDAETAAWERASDEDMARFESSV